MSLESDIRGSGSAIRASGASIGERGRAIAERAKAVGRQANAKLNEYPIGEYLSVRDHAFEYTQALGWLSVGLGLAEIIAPRTISRLTGIGYRPNLLRLFGFRELISGIGLLSQPSRSDWLWARVAGDALDLASLSYDLATNRWDRGKLAATTAAVAAVTAVDVRVGLELTEAA